MNPSHNEDHPTCSICMRASRSDSAAADSLACTPTAADADGETIAASYEWTIGTATYSGATLSLDSSISCRSSSEELEIVIDSTGISSLTFPSGTRSGVARTSRDGNAVEPNAAHHSEFG